MEVEKKEKLSRKQQIENKRIELYQGHLMESEPLQDVPQDLVENWLTVPIPSNTQRVLVIASNGITISRKPDGTIFNKFVSLLPNGSQTTKESHSQFCILDCLYHAESQTYFILDMMAWRGYLYYDCDTPFRNYWLNFKLSEVNCNQISSNNPYRFIALPYYECNKRGMETALVSSISLQGLLLYHKETHYNSGVSPLCCFLPIHLAGEFLSQAFSS